MASESARLIGGKYRWLSDLLKSIRGGAERYRWFKGVCVFCEY